MYTNTDAFGGNLDDVIIKEFDESKKVLIASGYISIDTLNKYRNKFESVVEAGGIAKLLLGMAFYEGLSEKKLELANSMNTYLSSRNTDSGVFVAVGRRYHGKVYQFDKDEDSVVYVGSSNFSSSGLAGNIECTIEVTEEAQKNDVKRFLSELYTASYSRRIDKTEIIVPGKKKIVQKKVESLWASLGRYNPAAFRTDTLPNFVFSLDRVADIEKSNLNVYFGKGRLNRKTGVVKPRPWYEIELIANKELNTNPVYPKGDFLAYTDDGYIIPMRTQGDYYKNIRSKNSLQIFGKWLKGKLEKKGVLNKFEPVTLDTLIEYGSTEIIFYKIEEGKYYLKF